MVLVEIEGVETEVFTAADVAARETAIRETVTGEFTPKLTQAEKDLGEARKALGERAGEFATFRKLSDEQVAALSVAQRTIYENGLVIADQQAKIEGQAKTAHETAVTALIKSKAGSDATLTEKLTDMYKIINIDDSTPDGREARANAALGAIGGTQPDLLAAAGLSFGGGFTPPVKQKEEKSYADSDAGKAGAAEFGLITEEPKA